MTILTDEERATAAGERGAGAAMAMRIVAESARLMGAPRLIPVASAHIDGALYHGDSGTLFAEKLVEGGAKVASHPRSTSGRSTSSGVRASACRRTSGTWPGG